MRIAVTGGAGFLGSHVADVLSHVGHDVFVVDVQQSERHATRQADLLDETRLRHALEGAEVICHLAAVGDVYLAAERPGLAAQVNVVGTANVCEAALGLGVRRLIYASTWEVYGKPEYEPMDENHPCRPDHPYSVTKLAGERLAMAYGHLRGLDVVALRLGTAFGTRMRPNSVFSLFIDRALRGETITIQGDGNQGRQFTHATDIGRAFAAAVDRAGRQAVYNVMAPELVTINDLAELVSSFIPARIEHVPARKADVPSALVSSVNATKDLGWSPAMAFRDGVRELVEERSMRSARDNRSTASRLAGSQTPAASNESAREH